MVLDRKFGGNQISFNIIQQCQPDMWTLCADIQFHRRHQGRLGTKEVRTCARMPQIVEKGLPHQTPLQVLTGGKNNTRGPFRNCLIQTFLKKMSLTAIGVPERESCIIIINYGANPAWCRQRKLVFICFPCAYGRIYLATLYSFRLKLLRFRITKIAIDEFMRWNSIRITPT